MTKLGGVDQAEIKHALLAAHMRAVAAGVREAFAAVGTLERLLAAVDPYVLLEVVFELERLAAFLAFELAQRVFGGRRRSHRDDRVGQTGGLEKIFLC